MLSGCREIETLIYCPWAYEVVQLLRARVGGSSKSLTWNCCISQQFTTKEWEQSQTYTCTSVFIAALCSIAKRQTIQVSVNRWINIHQMWYMFTTGYYSAILKRSEVLIHAASWINFENNMLNEINETQKDWYCLIVRI